MWDMRTQYVIIHLALLTGATSVCIGCSNYRGGADPSVAEKIVGRWKARGGLFGRTYEFSENGKYRTVILSPDGVEMEAFSGTFSVTGETITVRLELENIIQTVRITHLGDDELTALHEDGTKIELKRVK